MSASIPIKLQLTSPVGAASVIGSSSLGGLVTGLDDLPILNLVADLVGHAGGVLDVYLQSRDNNTLFTQSTNPWRDIAHFAQLAAGAVAISYRIAFQRGISPPSAPQVVNAVENVPTLAAGTVLSWANGAEIRLLLVGGAGGAGGAVITIQGSATFGV